MDLSDTFLQTFGLQFTSRSQMDKADEVLFSWHDKLPLDETDFVSWLDEIKALFRQEFDVRYDNRQIRLSGDDAVRLMVMLAQRFRTKGFDLFDYAQEDLRLFLSVLQLAQAVVAKQDILAAAFVHSHAPSKCLQILLETAATGDDIMPTWASGNGLFVASWIPAWRIPELRAIRKAVMSCAYDQTGPSRKVQSLVDEWLVLCVDVLVRESIFEVADTTETSGTSFRVMYRGEADVFESWKAALQGQDRTFTADGWLVARSMRQALHGTGYAGDDFDDESGREFYRLVFELEAPKSGGASDWRLHYVVKHKHFAWKRPFASWWAQESAVWAVGQDKLWQPDTWILPLLRQAASVCPQVAQSLRLPAPSGCVIAADDVYPFLTETVPQLQEKGFSIEAPDVVSADDSNIRIRVRVKRAKSENRRRGIGGNTEQWFDVGRLVEFDWSVVIDDEEISRDAFLELVAEQTPFANVNGSWRLVPVNEILRQLNQVGGTANQSARLLDLSRALLMSQASSDVPLQIEYQDEALPVERVMEVFTHASDPPLISTPRGFVGELRHYQQIGYSWLLHLREIGCGACLADDMGLGKTVQILAYLQKVKEESEEKRTHLLVCPTSLLPNWRAEIAKFTPELKIYVHHGQARDMEPHMRAGHEVDLVMTTYATLVRDLELFEAYTFDSVVIDEAQNVKNSDTKQAQAIRSIHSQHRIALTGTPIENRLEELWALMDFLNPGYLGTLSWFRKTLADPTSKNPGSESSRKLQVLLRPVLLRRRKTDPEIQTELPDKWEVSEHAYLTSEQAAMYQALVNQLFTTIEPLQGAGIQRRGQILATLVRLKQICDHPCLVAAGDPSVHRSGKLRQLIELLKTVIEDGESALIFTQFRDMGEILCDSIGREFSVRPQFLHGGLSAAVRGKMVDDFQTGKDPSPVLVLSLRAGGVGLNLTRANHVFHFDRWWNPAVEDQATDRAYRIGQTKDVQVHKMICSGTLEERIDDLISSKRELSRAIVGGSNEWVTEMSDDELRALFALGDLNVWEEDDA